MEMIRFAPPLTFSRRSLVRMDSPFGFRFARQAGRFGLVAALCGGWALTARAGGPAQGRLFGRLLAVDAQLSDAPQEATARAEFDRLAHAASPCAAAAGLGEDRARCVVDALFRSGQLSTVEDPGDPQSSTVTSVLASHKGNCAALTAVALALAERVGVPMEAVVFPRHVVVRSPADPDHALELLQRGSELTMAQTRKRLGADGARDTRVRANAFPAYYMDNLAVRFAEAGNADRAETMFKRAIEDSPRMPRVRFNYGTFLLGKGRHTLAEKQLRRAVRLDSRNPPAWANLGVAVARLGDTAEARRCFQRALRYDPRNRVATDNLKALGRDGPPPPR